MDPDKSDDFEAIIAALPDMVFVITESGKYASVLGGDETSKYHDGSVLKGLTLFDVLPERKAHWFKSKIHEALVANTLQVFEYSLSGEEVKPVDVSSGPVGEQWFEGRVSPLQTRRYGEKAVVWIARNITERRKLEQKLVYQAEMDPLSEVFNRRKLLACLNETFKAFQHERVNATFLLLDVDNFKTINDEHGHQIGDTVLKRVADACRSILKESDIIGRLGGDEFGILHCSSQGAEGEALSRRLNEVVASMRFNDPQLPLSITVSIGASQFDVHDTGIESIYQRADNALYTAKRSGKNTSVIANQ
ncbi:sensor domain-containing diguanylate cyclase [Thaumasiovibrio subtropicus]|uniref:sensor domain-containing diguanylate cyclase n=1 Tax=Thaumasiovibrio subtropicus TaxID=1891207 RepID=UPI000B34F383|nr:sensor domain-containing diguanylate cyclase [Thaumasiovibrio subtropicus]